MRIECVTHSGAGWSAGKVLALKILIVIWLPKLEAFLITFNFDSAQGLLRTVISGFPGFCCFFAKITIWNVGQL